MAAAPEETIGRNGVVITKRPLRDKDHPGYRTYEVYQRERVGESTEKIKPIQLTSEDYRTDPYPLVEILRENYPCYRDWLSNSYWISRYNDVTSIFADEANFETRPKAWLYGMTGFGRNLRDELPVLAAEERLIDANAADLAESLAAILRDQGEANLATSFAALFASTLLCHQLDLPADQQDQFTALYWRMQRGTSWQPALQQDGEQAIHELVTFFEPIVSERRSNPGEDLVSAIIEAGGDTTSAADVVITLLEGDHQTLHGALANLWFLLLTHPEEYAKAKSERRLMKLAYLETLRHSTPVITAQRFARHEVERFGRLLPEGARLLCSAAAANRDPRIFNEPDRFIVDRRDMCQREPRGHYRADGLATGIVFGLGKPSKHPAVPEDRPRSRYAITRDTAVTASVILSEALPGLRLAPGASPQLSSLTVGEMHTCWQLPVKTQ
jgi:pulcherriminic acid synthase